MTQSVGQSRLSSEIIPATYSGACPQSRRASRFPRWRQSCRPPAILVAARVTDDALRFADPARVGTRAFVKLPAFGGPTKPAYYGGKCALLSEAGCKAEAECGLNQGKMGYNDEKLAGSAGYYCGRVKCLTRA